MLLESIFIYPVKSMSAKALEQVDVECRGPKWDRRWMLVGTDDRFITGRTVPELARFRASVAGGTLTMELDGDQLSVPCDAGGVRRVVVWRDSLEVADCGDAAAAWLSQKLKREVRLVFQRDQDRRGLPEEKRVGANDEVSLADGYPVLLIGTASLESLNQSLERPVAMERFRPNLVVRTTEPYIEDTWRRIVIGDVAFAVGSQCTRCVFTTVDPRTGVLASDREPLTTLLRTRRREADFKPVFGMNLIPESTGLLRQGDALTVCG